MIGHQRLLIKVGDGRPQIFLVLADNFFASSRPGWLRCHGIPLATDKHREAQMKAFIKTTKDCREE
jgi:hypothetical protein